MKKATIIFMIIFTGMIPLFAKPKGIASIDSLLTEMTRQDLFSGAVLIADSSGVLLSKGYGYSDRENNVKNTPDTRFDVSTTSNVFTGTVITLLAQQGKLKFTDTIDNTSKDCPKGMSLPFISCSHIQPVSIFLRMQKDSATAR